MVQMKGVSPRRLGRAIAPCNFQLIWTRIAKKGVFTNGLQFFFIKDFSKVDSVVLSEINMLGGFLTYLLFLY